MRKSAIPLVFFVIMCSLNILLAGCGLNQPVSKTPNSPARTSALITPAPVDPSCNSCQAHELTAVTSLAPMMVASQTTQEAFPPSMNLIDAKINETLQQQQINIATYSRNGKVLTFTYPDNAKLIVTIDDNALVKEVKKVDANNVIIERFSHTYGAFSAPLAVRNLQGTSPTILATANYNYNQQLYSITDNVNAQTHVIPNPVSPYPPLLYMVPPPAESGPTTDGFQQNPPSAAVQACWSGCGNTYAQAKTDAYSDLSITVAAALAVYVAGLLVCLASAVFYPVCAAGFFAAYAAAIAAATAAWITALDVAAAAYADCMNACCVANGIPINSWKGYIAIPASITDPWNTPSQDDLN